jgi:hypothetical protein
MPTQTSTPTAPATYTVPSATTPGITYTVTADESGVLTCNCRAGTYPKTRGRCWHLKAVHSGAIRPNPVPVAAPGAAHDTTIVEGFDSFGRPLFTPLCRTCHRVGVQTHSRSAGEAAIAAHISAQAVRS